MAKILFAGLLCCLPLILLGQGGVFVGYNIGPHSWRNFAGEAYEFNLEHLHYDELMKAAPYYKGLNLGYVMIEEDWGMMVDWSNKHVRTFAEGQGNDGNTWQHSRKIRMNTLDFSFFFGKYPFYFGTGFLLAKMKSFEKNAPKDEFDGAKYERWDASTKDGLLSSSNNAGLKTYILVYLPFTKKTAIQLMPYAELYLRGMKLDYTENIFNIQERYYKASNVGLSAALMIGPTY